MLSRSREATLMTCIFHFSFFASLQLCIFLRFSATRGPDRTAYQMQKLLTALLLAECERVFSHVSLFKTKPRNERQTRAVNGALLSASCVKGSGPSCVHFTPGNGVFSRTNRSLIRIMSYLKNPHFSLERYLPFDTWLQIFASDWKTLYWLIWCKIC